MQKWDLTATDEFMEKKLFYISFVYLQLQE